MYNAQVAAAKPTFSSEEVDHIKVKPLSPHASNHQATPPNPTSHYVPSVSGDSPDLNQVLNHLLHVVLLGEDRGNVLKIQEVPVARGDSGNGSSNQNSTSYIR